MLITIKQTGGFAGIPIELKSIDTSEMNAEAVGHLEKIFQELNFFELPETYPATEIGADIGAYEVTVVDDDRQHTVSMAMGESPEAAPLREFVERILSTA